MSTDNPDTNSRPSESPSGRPMTLRQQLKDLLGTDLHESCGDECGDKERFIHGIEAIERWCQEIAREAAKEQIMQDFLSMLDSDAFTDIDESTLIVWRDGQLTQQQGEGKA